MARRIKLRCPICKKAVVSTGADFPFCSERCKEVDLGKWASGAYVISSPSDEDEVMRDANLGANLDDGDESS